MFQKKNKNDRICKNCNKHFVMKTYNQVFCCDNCRNDFFNEITAKAKEQYKNQPRPHVQNLEE